MSDCKYGDPSCPCQDGDLCHYEGENPMTPPAILLARLAAEQLRQSGWRVEAIVIESLMAQLTHSQAVVADLLAIARRAVNESARVHPDFMKQILSAIAKATGDNS